MRRLRRPPKGFTLLELVVVIAIIGILASLGVPSMRRSYQRMVNRNEAYLVRETILAARNQARRVLCPVDVALSGNTMTITTVNPSNACSDQTFTAKSVTFDSALSLGTLQDETGTPGTLRFTKNGGVDGGKNWSLSIQANTAKYVVTIYSGIGQVRIAP